LADSVLILAPLLVLAVVLLLAFAGCSFHPGAFPSTLTFRARVSTELTVLAPGVEFAWTLSNGATGGASVIASTSGLSVETYITTSLNLGPELFWTLGSVNGIQDRSGQGKDGAPLGGITIGGDADGPTEFGDATATVFDGSDDGVGSLYNPFVGTAPRTFVGWARWAAGGPALYTLFSSSAGDADRPALRVVVANRNIIFLPSGNDGQQIIWPAAAGPEGSWFMWTLVADPGSQTATLFINGARVSASAMTDPWPTAPGTFQVGVGETTRQPFKGSQGLIAVYERGLSDAEVASIYQVSLGGENVYEYAFGNVGDGSLVGRCTMSVEADGQTADGDSGDFPFTVSSGGQHYVLVFTADGSPEEPPFNVTTIGLTTE
jgi:hypothetical protein